MKINQNGYWENPTGEGHAYDCRLSQAILKLIKKHDFEYLLDLGCGMADYSKHFSRFGIQCDAYDGNPNTKELTGGIGQVLDLSKQIDLGCSYDVVLSLEVGEHIPATNEQKFIDNICNHATSMIILSWAVPGQAGDGHVNCQSNEYIIAEMNKRGFYLENVFTAKLRKSSSLWWFKNSLMVFI